MTTYFPNKRLLNALERIETMPKILRNAVKCNNCGDIIESTHRHDFKWCSCGLVAVDGGHDYLKRCYKSSNENYKGRKGKKK